MKTLLPGITLTVVLVAAGCATNPFNPPPPPTSPGAIPPTTTPTPGSAEPTTPQPGNAVTEADLPTEAEVVWNEQARWTAGATRSGGGEEVTPCLENGLDSLNPNAVLIRDFALGGTNGTAAAVAMSFGSTADADQAYATLRDRVGACGEALPDQARQAVPPQAITVAGGRGEFTEWSYPVAQDNSEFESQGIYQVDDRVGLLVMRTQGQDNNWDFEPGGPVGMLHPQLRSVPPAAEKLAS